MTIKEIHKFNEITDLLKQVDVISNHVTRIDIEIAEMKLKLYFDKEEANGKTSN